MKENIANRYVKAQCVSVLSRALQLHYAVCSEDIDSLKTNTPFDIPEPLPPPLDPLPREPLKADAQFRPRKSLGDIFSRARKQQKINEAEARFTSAHAAWQVEYAIAQSKANAAEQEYAEACSEWENGKVNYCGAQSRANASIDSLKESYLEMEPDAVLQICRLAFMKLRLLTWLDSIIRMRYEKTDGFLIVDFELPTPDELFSLEKVDPQIKIDLKQRERSEIYDSVVYQIWLSVVNAFFSADTANAIQEIVFNGTTNAIDRATGNKFSACILSVRTTKSDFNKLNLSAIDPRACFKAFNGIGATKLHGIVPVQPIVAMNRDDERFVANQDVTSGLNAGVNLAAIGWEEFEHLIRQIFEQEFARNNSEVRVTKASRDGGVDAVIFDPDPIHGGKIVIQAKRYTNTVGVAAVRELYGTVLNEGASKGILVTTSSFGPDAHAFAANKPLSLLDGQNLLYLLGKHGHQAHIDLDKAKAMGVALLRYGGSIG